MSRLVAPTLVVTLLSAALAACSGVAAADYGLFRNAMPEERLAFVLLCMPYLGVVVGPVLAVVAMVLRKVRASWAKALGAARWGTATFMFLGTMLLLGPVGGFHHMFRFGFLGYAILDCEERTEAGACQVHGSLLLAGVSVLLWLGLAFGLHRLRGRSTLARS